MPKYGSFENQPVSQKPLPVEAENTLNFNPWGRKGVYVHLHCATSGTLKLANAQVGSQAERQGPWASCYYGVMQIVVLTFHHVHFIQA